MAIYQFDGTLTGLLCCVFRAFEFKEFEVQIRQQASNINLASAYRTTANNTQSGLFDDWVEVASHDAQADRVWQGLKARMGKGGMQRLWYAFLSEQDAAFQAIFDTAVYAFQSKKSVDADYGHAAVLAVAQWCKQVGREKHRMEAFVRFKKAKDGLFIALVKPDFNVLPLIERHFKARYQDQRWLIYDEQRDYGIYYDLHKVHQVHMQAASIDTALQTGHSQNFAIELDDDEALYDQLWKDYFNAVNIQARHNMKLHVQYVPRRYWRYMNEKVV